MALPPEPDFLHFQQLVDEARKSITTYCPEWTDYNLSDPGITLIELFAAMTTRLNYRLNRVPEKSYHKFLELLDAAPRPPEPATTELTFYLSSPFPLARANGGLDYAIQTLIPADTQVATRRATGNETEVIFTVEQENLIAPPRLLHIRRDFEGRDVAETFRINYRQVRQTQEGSTYELARDGFQAFQEMPQEGDTFYLGFDETHDIRGYFLQLTLDCGEGAGVTVYDPPLVWEYFDKKQNNWQRLRPEEDTTLALTANGQIKLHLPLTAGPTPVRGITAYWLRCRLFCENRERQHLYTRSPRITRLEAYVLGITVPAMHSAPVSTGEILGEGNSEPGQTYTLSRAPLLPLNPDRQEYVEVEAEQPDGTIRFIPWTEVKDFSGSTIYDRHFTLNLGSGEICFGPGIYQQDGSVRQYGAVPQLGRKIRITRYRTGGGVNGNVPAGSLRVLKRPINYVFDVTNRVRAAGGKDPEQLAEAKLRAQEILRQPKRAVTAQDYEEICRGLGYIARVKCLDTNNAPDLPRGMVRLLVVPTLDAISSTQDDSGYKDESLPSPNGSESRPDLLDRLQIDSIRARLEKDLEAYRLLGLRIDIGQPVYLEARIEADIQCALFNASEEITDRVLQGLQHFITPLPILPTPVAGYAGQSANGRGPKSPPIVGAPTWAWPFGRKLYISDIYARLKAIDGVEHVTNVGVWWRQRVPGENPVPEPQWQRAQNDIIPVPADGLLVLLDQVQIRVNHEQQR